MSNDTQQSAVFFLFVCLLDGFFVVVVLVFFLKLELSWNIRTCHQTLRRRPQVNCNCPFRSSFLLSPSLTLHKTRAETLATQAGGRRILSYLLSWATSVSLAWCRLRLVPPGIIERAKDETFVRALAHSTITVKNQRNYSYPTHDPFLTD